MEKKTMNVPMNEESVRATFISETTGKPIKCSILENNQDTLDYLIWLKEFSEKSLQSKLIVK